MPRYYYKAADGRGAIRSGWLEAEHERDLELRLSHKDLMLIRWQLREDRPFAAIRSLFHQKVGQDTLILFCLHMQQMLAAGNSIPSALEGVRESIECPLFHDVITSILIDIRNGKTFSDALETHAEVIPRTIAIMVRVGERSGRMVEIFEGLGSTMKWEADLQRKAIQAFRYPLFVGLIIFAVGLFMMVFVVPQMIGFLEEMGKEIPFLTRALIAVSQFLTHWWWTLVVVPPLLVAMIRLACRLHPGFRLAIDRWLLRLWLFGPLAYRIFLIRFTANFALMYRSGVPVLEAIEMNGGLSRNQEVVNRVQRVAARVSHGLSISAAFGESHLLPPPLPKLLEAGEAGGQLSTALMNVSYFLDRDVRERVDKLQAMVEPVLTLVLGLILIWIILSVFAPIYQTVSEMGM